MTQVTLFISCVSKEFLSYREALRKALERPNVSVKIQDDFISSGRPTLDKLENYIRHCDGVIHIVGDMTGAEAKPASVEAIAGLCPELATRIPEIAAAFDKGKLALTYTQWEAYLAIYHKKALLIAVPAHDADREPGTYVKEDSQILAQQSHLERLRAHEMYPGFEFADANELALGVYRSTIHDLLVRAGIADATALLAPSDDTAERRHRELLEAIAREKGVDPKNLRPILENLDLDPNVSLADIPRLLNERIDAMRAAAALPIAPSNEGEDIDIIRRRSRAALDEAKTDEAIDILDRQLIEERDAMEDRKRRITTLLADKANVQRLRYDYPAARATLKEMLRIDPDQTWCWIDLGDDWTTVGALTEAKESYDAALALARKSSDEREESVALSRIGNVQVAKGSLKQALQSFRDSHAIADRLAKADSGNAERQRDLEVSYNKIGDVQFTQGALTDALQSFRNSLAIADRLAKADPGNAEWQRDLSISNAMIASVLEAQGDIDGALLGYRETLNIQTRLAKADPGNAGWQRDLCVSYNRIGDVQVAQGALTEALQSFRDSLAMIDRLAKADPGNAGWQRDLSVSFNKIGDVQIAQGALTDALQSFRSSQDIFDRLAKADAGNAEWQRDLAVSNERIAIVYELRNEREPAIQFYKNALAIYNELLSVHPDNTFVLVSSTVPLLHIGALSGSDGKPYYEKALGILVALDSHGRLELRRKDAIIWIKEQLAKM